ncbi:MAG: SpoIIE family protein phosphatase [Acidobacteriota bacterium]|nr:SpoIIE family protein phosphatase [Acidobacteriota bacterium]
MTTVLIIDDSEFSRAQLKLMLQKLGHEVLIARDGKEGWRRLQKNPVNLVITDWMMPEMDGLGLCRRVRQAEFNHYIYIILLTIRDGKNDMVEALEAGADDFITKPCTLPELRVKLHNGERILAYEEELLKRNRQLAEAHEEMRRGLKSVSRFHQTLLPPGSHRLEGLHFESRSGVCDIASGDMFNFIPLDADRCAFYLLDVAGHGIPAAMFSFSLSHIISPSPSPSNAPGAATRGLLDLHSPTELTLSLNRMFQARTDDWLSFTIIYGIIDKREQRIRFVQGGHPPLIYIPHDGPVRPVGDGGFPVGFFEEAEFEEYGFDFRPGDRIILYSDGVTECLNIQEKPYTTGRLLDKVEQVRSKALAESIAAIHQNLADWRDSSLFNDDWSLIGIEYDQST